MNLYGMIVVLAMIAFFAFALWCIFKIEKGE